MSLRRRGVMGAEHTLRMLWHNISTAVITFVERILQKILPVIKKETIKRLLIWVGWVLMIVAEAFIESAE